MNKMKVVTVFDLFGLKAKRRVAELESNLLASYRDNQALKIDVVKCESEKTRLYEQLKTVRLMANQMRDRVRSHGATELERNFLDVCQNIHAHGKMISTMRFHHMLELAKKERESLTQAVGAGQ